MASGDPERIRAIDGQFAIVQKRGNLVRMARSIGRPMRYFLAKQADGPCLIVAERIDELHEQLQEGRAGRSIPPVLHADGSGASPGRDRAGRLPGSESRLPRFFDPERNKLGADLDAIGRAYIGTLADECARWLDRIDPREPIGVLFSGGVDSGSVFLVLYHLLLQRGQAPARLKAFTLAVDGQAADLEQSLAFPRSTRSDNVPRDDRACP